MRCAGMLQIFPSPLEINIGMRFYGGEGEKSFVDGDDFFCTHRRKQKKKFDNISFKLCEHKRREKTADFLSLGSVMQSALTQ